MVWKGREGGVGLVVGLHGESVRISTVLVCHRASVNAHSRVITSDESGVDWCVSLSPLPAGGPAGAMFATAIGRVELTCLCSAGRRFAMIVL